MLSRTLRPFSRLVKPSPQILARSLATEATSPRPPQSREYQTVEDLHNKTAHEILAGKLYLIPSLAPPLSTQLVEVDLSIR